jgi:hypothetical protein
MEISDDREREVGIPGLRMRTDHMHGCIIKTFGI